MHRKLIIEKPQSQDKTQRLAQGTITAAFWFLFLYLLRPIFTLIAWIVGAVIFSREMVGYGGFEGLQRSLLWYLLVILIIAIVLRSWAWYNLKHFGGHEKRRTFIPPVPLNRVAAFYHVDPVELSCWQKSGWLLIIHDEQGRILHVRHREPQVEEAILSPDQIGYGMGRGEIAPV